MSELRHFPLPHVFEGRRGDGSMWPWPRKCESCEFRPCEGAPPGDVGVCPWGYNFCRVGSSLLVAGFVLDGFSGASPAWTKRRRKHLPVPNRLFARLVEGWREAEASETEATQAARRAREEDLLDEDQFRVEYLASLKKEVLRGLGFVHDYKQINSQLIQNINVVIETRYEGVSFDEKLAAASQEEQAIYWAGHFLNEKLNVARFLLRPEWLHIRDECARSRVHGMVLKYVRIYQPWYDRRNVRLRMIGKSYGEVVANTMALGVLPHTFIDNALKYSPDGAEVEIFVGDEDDGVLLETSSYGPPILDGEERGIFRAFTRGTAAVDLAEDGVGYGLYISQLIAKEHLGTTIEVSQDASRTAVGGRVWTTFSVLIPRVARVAQ